MCYMKYFWYTDEIVAVSVSGQVTHKSNTELSICDNKTESTFFLKLPKFLVPHTHLVTFN